MNRKSSVLLILSLSTAMFVFATSSHNDSMVNPLKKYAVVWSGKQYNAYNTGATAEYLSEEEKNVLWVLNLARAFPQQFLRTVVLNPMNKVYYVRPEKRNNYFNTLIATMKTMKPIKTPLTPDSLAFISARCHAIQTGISGQIGHDRASSGCSREFQGECCDYGNDNAVNVLLNLLIDDDYPGVGHRVICLSNAFTKIGVAMQPHKVYRINTVMDFKW